MKCLSGQVATATELRVGEILHCGQTGGQCMKWLVTAVDKTSKKVTMRVGGTGHKNSGTMVNMTGRDIRNGLPMFRIAECPFCLRTQPPITNSVALESEPVYVTTRLEAADVESALSRVDNKRSDGTRQGGARIRTPKDLFNTNAEQIAKRILGIK